MRHLMEGSWHCIGTTLEFPHDGSYRTTQLLDRPIITWRYEGQYTTFLNVCPHRFATLTDAPSGQCDRLVCQYHGWEFDETGNTRKIPDAVHFKPLEKGKLGLAAFRTEVVGNLIFVHLKPDGIDIDEYLGPHRSFVDEFFGGPRQLVFQDDLQHNANWKIVVENSLESYHVTMVHAKTLGTTADAQTCTHELYEHGSKFIEDTSQRATSTDRMERLALDFIRFPHSRKFQHLLINPNGMLTSVPPFSVMQWTTPVSPTTSISRWRILGFANREPTVRDRLAAPFLRRFAKKFFPVFLAEDLGIQEAVQRGHNSAQIPQGGLISAREERIYHFQKMVAKISPPEHVAEHHGNQDSDQGAMKQFNG